jgi:cytochrome oxidase Cu insertion factor (SCO1/SenC/PrrC family)
MSERENALENELRSRNLRMLAVLAGLFLLPLAVAFWMYYGTAWRPARRVNHGELIIPARPLPAAHLQPAVMQDTVPAELFHRKWSLVYVGDGRCDDACRKALYVMRQTRLSLNNEMSRVDRVFLATAQCCARDYLAPEYPGLLVLDATGPSASPLLGVFPVNEREQSLFVVDPLGNLMMSYDVRQNPKGLLQDLKKLLSLSHIG